MNSYGEKGTDNRKIVRPECDLLNTGLQEQQRVYSIRKPKFFKIKVLNGLH